MRYKAKECIELKEYQIKINSEDTIIKRLLYWHLKVAGWLGEPDVWNVLG